MRDQEKPKTSTTSIWKLTLEYAKPFSKDVLASQASYRISMYFQANLFWVYLYETHWNCPESLAPDTADASEILMAFAFRTK